MPYSEANIERRGKAGFTLLELSIAMVVIGILIGAVLLGADMIGTANVRRQIGQIQEYNTAVYGFVARFGYLPGDYNDAAAYGLSPAGGDSDNVLDDGAGTSTYQGENAAFFQHLSGSRFINDPFASGSNSVTSINANLYLYFPKATVGSFNYVTVFSDGTTNYYEILAINTVTAGAYNAPGSTLTPQQARSLDNKTDDGKPLQGEVQAITDNGAGLINTTPTPGAAACVLTGGQEYNMGDDYVEAKLCRLRIQMPKL